MGSDNKRLYLFLLLTFSSILGIQYLMDVTGLTPPPPKKLPNVAKHEKPDALAGKPVEKDAPAPVVPDQARDEAAPEKPPVGAKPETPATRVARVDPAELVLGSTKDQGPK